MEDVKRLLQKLVIMNNVKFIEKSTNKIIVGLDCKFKSSNARLFVDILEGFKWEIKNEHSTTYINILLDDESSHI